MSQSFEIKWCEEHDQFVAGMNDHCGCEFSEGCWFDNSSVRHGETTTPCRIVSKMVVDKPIDQSSDHKGTWHYLVPQGQNEGQERCDYFGSDCPHFLHDDHALKQGGKK